jgi:hypothetical protein
MNQTLAVFIALLMTTVSLAGCIGGGNGDDDGDGVMNDVDICPLTPTGETVDTDGCSQTQLDDDVDGVMNNLDLCPLTPAGETVDTDGCSQTQLDDDGDGVMNNLDLCPLTPAGETVDTDGCSQTQLDDDSDGVMNNLDLCPLTPAGETVDTDGCSQTQLEDGEDTGAEETESTPDYTNLEPDCFAPYSTTPIIGPQDTFFPGSTWGDPTVLKVGDEFIMYASSSIYTDSEDPSSSWDQNIKIYRLTSPDGMDWSLNPTTAVFERSASGWDEKSTETPSVVYYQGKYHLFYTGYPAIFNDALAYRIGHASSDDGITWTRETPEDTALLGPSDPLNDTPQFTFDQWIVAEPGAVVFNDKIYLYFAATGTNSEVNSTAEVVGLSIYDGENDTWSAQKEVMRADQTVYPRTDNIKGFSTPSATIIDGKVHLFVTVVTDDPYNHYKVHHAYSVDGETDWVQDSTHIIEKTDLAWHEDDLIGPTALYDNKKVYLWYGGNQGTLDSLGIGLSICNL